MSAMYRYSFINHILIRVYSYNSEITLNID